MPLLSPSAKLPWHLGRPRGHKNHTKQQTTGAEDGADRLSWDGPEDELDTNRASNTQEGSPSRMPCDPCSSPSGGPPTAKFAGPGSRLLGFWVLLWASASSSPPGAPLRPFRGTWPQPGGQRHRPWFWPAVGPPWGGGRHRARPRSGAARSSPSRLAS